MDVWALGVLLVYMLRLEFPSDGVATPEGLQTHKDFVQCLPGLFDDTALVELLQGMLEIDQKARWSIQKVLGSIYCLKEGLSREVVRQQMQLRSVDHNLSTMANL